MREFSLLRRRGLRRPNYAARYQFIAWQRTFGRRAGYRTRGLAHGCRIDVANLRTPSKRTRSFATRVSQIEHSQVDRAAIRGLADYVAALGGRLELVADFGDERIVIG